MNLIATIIIWSGVVFGFILGIYLNIVAYRKKRERTTVKWESIRTIKGNLNDSSTVVYLSHVSSRNQKQTHHKGFEGNIVLESDYEYEYDCV